MAAARVVALLPPSETKAPGGRSPRWDASLGGFGALSADRLALAALLAETDALARLKPAAAARTLAAPGSPTMPALARYTGVLYDALDVASFTSAQRRSAGGRLAIVSGLAGLVLGRDPLPDYSLPIGTVLPRAGGLASWWKPRLSPALDAFVAGAVVWDLLPGAHASAWTPGDSWRSRWQVRVLREAADGSRTVVSHDNKATKGALARHMVLASPTGPEDLADWRGPHGAALDLTTSVIGKRGGILDLVAPAP